MTARQIGKTTLQFDDPKLRRLMAHVDRMTEELQKIQAMLGDGQPGQILVKRSAGDFDGMWAGESTTPPDDGGGGGGGDGGSGSGSSGAIALGEVNTGRNVGEGTGIYAGKTGVILNFRSLANGAGIEIVVDEETNVVRISATNEAAAAAGQFEPLVIAGAFA